jgi:hypothetical protein
VHFVVFPFALVNPVVIPAVNPISLDIVVGELALFSGKYFNGFFLVFTS